MCIGVGVCWCARGRSVNQSISSSLGSSVSFGSSRSSSSFRPLSSSSFLLFILLFIFRPQPHGPSPSSNASSHSPYSPSILRLRPSSISLPGSSFPSSSNLPMLLLFHHLKPSLIYSSSAHRSSLLFLPSPFLHPSPIFIIFPSTSSAIPFVFRLASSLSHPPFLTLIRSLFLHFSLCPPLPPTFHHSIQSFSYSNPILTLILLFFLSQPLSSIPSPPPTPLFFPISSSHPHHPSPIHFFPPPTPIFLFIL